MRASKKAKAHLDAYRDTGSATHLVLAIAEALEGLEKLENNAIAQHRCNDPEHDCDGIFELAADVIE